MQVWYRISKKYSIGVSDQKLDFGKLGLHPRFKTTRIAKRDNHCFFACPFCEPFTTIYSDHCRPAIERAGLTVERADEIFGTEPIIEDIVTAHP
jgi:hypothetical protein